MQATAGAASAASSGAGGAAAAAAVGSAGTAGAPEPKATLDASVVTSNVCGDPDFVTLNRLASLGVYGRLAYVPVQKPSPRDRIQAVGRAGD